MPPERPPRRAETARGTQSPSHTAPTSHPAVTQPNRGGLYEPAPATQHRQNQPTNTDLHQPPRPRRAGLNERSRANRREIPAKSGWARLGSNQRPLACVKRLAPIIGSLGNVGRAGGSTLIHGSSDGQECARIYVDGGHKRIRVVPLPLWARHGPHLRWGDAGLSGKSRPVRRANLGPHRRDREACRPYGPARLPVLGTSWPSDEPDL